MKGRAGFDAKKLCAKSSIHKDSKWKKYFRMLQARNANGLGRNIFVQGEEILFKN